MSCWTHITACFSVETGIVAKKPEVLKQVKSYLEDAPKITGSESDADIFVNVQTGYDLFGSDGKFQTRVVISIQGDLRDRMYNQTKKEFDEFLKYIKSKYYIRDYAVNIERDC